MLAQASEGFDALTASSLCVSYEALRFSGERRGVASVFGLRRHVFPVLDSVSFALTFDNPLITIVGANGVGKTTLLRAISGVVPSTGSILWNDISLDRLSYYDRVRRGIVFVPHEGGLFPGLTVQENLRLVERNPERRRKILEALLDTIGMRDTRLRGSLGFLRGDSKVGNLSGGERKILTLLRVLFQKRDLILLDEPMAGLAPNWLELYYIILGYLRPVNVIQAEQYSRLTLARRMGSKMLELKEGALAPLTER